MTEQLFECQAASKRLPRMVWIAVLATVGACQGPPGPPGPPGAVGPPGPAGGSAAATYVRESAAVTVTVSTTDVRTVACDPGDAATGAATEKGADPGVPGGGPASSHLSTVPVMTGTTPTGFEFTVRCASGGGCPVVHRVLCADLSP